MVTKVLFLVMDNKVVVHLFFSHSLLPLTIRESLGLSQHPEPSAGVI